MIVKQTEYHKIHANEDEKVISLNAEMFITLKYQFIHLFKISC